MPSLVATYNVRYVWTLPEGVLLLEQYNPLNRPENEGSYYIRYDVLHYVWKGKWYEVQGEQDGFTSASPDDAEFHAR